VRLAAFAALLLSACQSSAPYTLPAALANTGLALGVSAAQRAGGGCYATCTGGSVCNPSTGLCEAASARQVCSDAPGGGMRCTPVDVRASRRADERSAPPVSTEVGASPATGTTPPAPADASPRTP
jgi:CelD/BcsL family acetyltransferase involved in cellulose biosynthesis